MAPDRAVQVRALVGDNALLSWEKCFILIVTLSSQVISYLISYWARMEIVSFLIFERRVVLEYWVRRGEGLVKLQFILNSYIIWSAWMKKRDKIFTNACTSLQTKK